MSTDARGLTLPSLLAAGAAAIAASVCCVVPLVLVLMGVSGAWIGSLAALDAWRPWFTGLTMVILAAAFWAAYRPQASCDGDSCAPNRLRRNRRWLWTGTIVIAALLTFPYYIPWLM
jgi:mercuric ion transport protein